MHTLKISGDDQMDSKKIITPKPAPPTRLFIGKEYFLYNPDDYMDGETRKVCLVGFTSDPPFVVVSAVGDPNGRKERVLRDYLYEETGGQGK